MARRRTVPGYGAACRREGRTVDRIGDRLDRARAQVDADETHVEGLQLRVDDEAGVGEDSRACQVARVIAQEKGDDARHLLGLTATVQADPILLILTHRRVRYPV